MKKLSLSKYRIMLMLLGIVSLAASCLFIHLIGSQLYADGVLRDEYWLYIEQDNFWANSAQWMAFALAWALLFFSFYAAFCQESRGAIVRNFCVVLACIIFLSVAALQYNAYHCDVLNRYKQQQSVQSCSQSKAKTISSPNTIPDFTTMQAGDTFVATVYYLAVNA